MLTILSAPDQFTPSPMGKPAVWKIQNSEYLTTRGQRNTYIIRIASSGSNGESFTLAGNAFTTSDAELYTSTTFDHTLADFRSAFNLANMLRTNAAFRAYSIKTVQPSNGQPWRVILVRSDQSDATAEDNNNDFSGLTGVSVEQIRGAEQQTLNARLWYQFWGSSGPVGPEQFAPFDGNGVAQVDGSLIARQIVAPLAPDPAQATPAFDLNGAAYLSLKFGVYETDGNCSPVFGSSRSTGAVPFIDAVLQYDQTEGLRPYGPARTGPLKWLTRRANTRTVNTFGFEWTAIYLGPSVYGIDGQRRLRKEFFSAGGSSLGVVTEDLNGVGLWRIPTGYQNAVPDDLNGVVYFTIVVQQINGFTWFDESETLTITGVNDGCRAAEVYYLEGLGSWNTLQFDTLQSRGLSMSSESWQRPVLHTDTGSSPSGTVLHDEGGNYQRVTASATTITLTKDKVKERYRKAVEEMLESPAAYLLTEDETGRPVTRRINFARESYALAQDKSSTSLSVSFTFAQPRRLR